MNKDNTINEQLVVNQLYAISQNIAVGYFLSNSIEHLYFHNYMPFVGGLLCCAYFKCVAIVQSNKFCKTFKIKKVGIVNYATLCGIIMHLTMLSCWFHNEFLSLLCGLATLFLFQFVIIITLNCSFNK